jgi:uncharacterized membrane protein YadS
VFVILFFIPFAFETFDFLAPEAVNLLKRIQKVLHSNIMSPKSMNVVFQRLSFVVQKGLAAQLAFHLPFIHVLLFYIYIFYNKM